MCVCRSKWELQSSPLCVLHGCSAGLRNAAFYKIAQRSSHLTQGSLEGQARAQRKYLFLISFMKTTVALYEIEVEVGVVTNLTGAGVCAKESKTISEECCCNKRFFESVHLMAVAKKKKREKKKKNKQREEETERNGEGRKETFIEHMCYARPCCKCLDCKMCL